MKFLRDYINLIDQAQNLNEADWDRAKSKVWARTDVTGDDDPKATLKTVKYDQSPGGEHKFTSLIQKDDDDEGTLNQRELPANTKLAWVKNEDQELDEASSEAVDKINRLFKDS